jgi:hypothetical protein
VNLLAMNPAIKTAAAAAAVSLRRRM